MKEVKTNLARNTLGFTVALVLQKVVAFVYFTILARFLGAENFGYYVFTLSYITIFAVIIDFGTNHYITREVAKNPSQAEKITANVFGFKLFSCLVALLAAWLIARWVNYDPLLIKLIYLASTVMVVESFVLSVYSIIRGFHNLKYESLATIGVHLLILGMGLLTVIYTNNLFLLLLVLLLAHGLNLLLGLYLLKFKFKLAICFQFDFQYWKAIALTILPFGLAAVFSKIYNAFDQTLLAKLAEPSELGYYGVAYKLTFSLQFFPLALMAALYPAMSKLYQEQNSRLAALFPRAVKYLLLLTFPIVALILVYGNDLITALYTEEYRAAVLPLQILIISLPLLFINFPIGSLLNASNQQIRQTINIGIAMVVNVILNFLLISNYQAVGAALASLFSTLVFFVLGWLAVTKIISLKHTRLGFFTLKLLLASLLLYGWAVWSGAYLVWYLSAGLAVLFFVLLAVFFRLLAINDLKFIITNFRKPNE